MSEHVMSEHVMSVRDTYPGTEITEIVLHPELHSSTMYARAVCGLFENQD
jgi:hypothetical protein